MVEYNIENAFIVQYYLPRLFVKKGMLLRTINRINEFYSCIKIKYNKSYLDVIFDFLNNVMPIIALKFFKLSKHNKVVVPKLLTEYDKVIFGIRTIKKIANHKKNSILSIFELSEIFNESSRYFKHIINENKRLYWYCAISKYNYAFLRYKRKPILKKLTKVAKYKQFIHKKFGNILLRRKIKK